LLCRECSLLTEAGENHLVYEDMKVMCLRCAEKFMRSRRAQ
jgi:hypothetical protein